MYKLCKTEQSAARQRTLELSLAELMLLQKYEDITVSEFCSFAGIPRKAFYRYFSSKDGALHALIDHTMLEYEHVRNSHPVEDISRTMENFFRFWKTQRFVLDALAFSGLSSVLLERAIGVIESDTSKAKILPGETEFSQRKILQFYVSGIMIMVINWHHSGYREDPREMAELTVRILNSPLLPYIQKLI